MRVTGNYTSLSLVNQLNTLAARQARLQNQAASGQRVSAPEDDPVALGRSLQLQSQNRQAIQYAQNIQALQNRASVAGNAFTALKKISDRASELATQADGTQSPAQLKASAAELRQLIQDAARLANGFDGNQYVFAGTASNQPPFVVSTDGDGYVTAVTYRGNTSVALNEIPNDSTLTVDAPGENNSGAGPRGVFSDSRYGADFFNHLISLQNHLLAGDTDAIADTDRPALQQDEDNLIYQTANNSVLQARLETAAATTETQQATLQQNLTNISGADLTSTLVQLTQTQNAYQLAAQSTARLLQMQQTLLNTLS